MTLVFCATYVRVFLLALQTLNVVGGHYAWAVATTGGLAVADVAIVLQVVKKGWASVPYVFLGGALGVTSAMYLHRFLI